MNSNKTHLHIVSFDIPFPTNYGGVIDVFYKIKTLSKQGIAITLHCYYENREQAKILENYCKKVYYYPRNALTSSFLSHLPLIVKSRANETLIVNLLKDNDPILFEGLHTTFPLYDDALQQGRKTFVRMHNIEHRYYKGLSISESNVFKQLFFKSESIKLKKYEKVLQKTDVILPISPYETDYFKKKYTKKEVKYLPPFHDNLTVKDFSNSKGEYALYHGDTRIPDNLRSIEFLINVFSKSTFPLIIAGHSLTDTLKKRIKSIPNISFKPLGKDDTVLKELFENAQINVMTTYQQTGIKLKLINALCQSRFTIGNDKLIKDTGLEKIVYEANTEKEFLKAIDKLKDKMYTTEDHQKKDENLQIFNNQKNIEIIMELL